MVARNHSRVAAVDEGSFVEADREIASRYRILKSKGIRFRRQTVRWFGGQKRESNLEMVNAAPNRQQSLLSDKIVETRKRVHATSIPQNVCAGSGSTCVAV